MGYSRKKRNLDKNKSKRKTYKKQRKTRKHGGYAEGYIPPYEQKNRQTRPSRGRTLRTSERRQQNARPINTGPTIINKTDGTTFYMGKLNGIGRYNGDVIYKNNQYLPHGQGTMEYNIGDVYRGQWQEGKRHGTGSYYMPKDNKTFEGEWVGDSFAPL